MVIVLLFFLLQALVTFVIKDYIPDNDAFGVILLLFSIIAVSMYLFKVLEKEMLAIIFIGFAVRVFILFVDLYVPSVPIFSSGDDSEYFHSASVAIANGLLPVSEGRTAYVPFLSSIYYLVGDQRPFAQFLNIAFWVFSAVYLVKILNFLKIDQKIIVIALLIFTFMPNSIIMSSILLRESIIIYLITISLYFFFLWMSERKFNHFLLAAVLAVLSMIFHSGMIGFVIVYILAFMFSKQERKEGNNRKSSPAILYLIFFVVLFVVLFQNNDLFLEKFDALGDEGVSNFDISGRGGSMYMESFNGLSGWVVYLIAPIKMFYFLFSPIPLDWRGLGDMVSFLFDSSFYLFLIGTILYGLCKSDMTLRNKIVISAFLVITVVIYSYGTANAGTAMRHRNKMIPLFLIMFAIAQNEILLRKSMLRKTVHRAAKNKEEVDAC
ncbi:hypothetical protein QWY14_07430 [Planococcus sp. N028]|uniref:Glycosyltransferase RgtA/B/C/D-like domain-containing protein n=1 Tax=Planococcus shixiaomingii TaxID=3058393 RepID=A0ABT8N153_9BACL|nr:hypothetical protein [Planococcus sp. N028]MDN7241619.1 hypothetical protein [Planococcus sp. N028]